MKLVTLSCAAFLALTAGAHAAEPSLKITSFRYAGENTRAAELCGKITGLEVSVTVRILADDNTNAPGTYYTQATKDGNFCAVIVSYRGRASANIVGAESVQATGEIR